MNTAHISGDGEAMVDAFTDRDSSTKLIIRTPIYRFSDS
jgi:hypothetical protein